MQPTEPPARQIREYLEKKLELGQIITSLDEVNALMHTEEESTVEREDHSKTESTSTGLAELSPPSPPGQWGNSRKRTSPVSQAPSEAKGSTPMELEDYTGIKELFAEPDEGLSKFQCRVRHILRVGCIQNMSRDPYMYGRIIGRSAAKLGM